MKKILSILSVAALLMLSITLATAQTPRSVTVPLVGVNGSAVKGEAVLTEDSAGTKVVVSLSGYTAAQQSAGHIHTGKCDAQGPVFVSLSTITADAQGNGKAESVITPTLTSLQTGNFYVQYHSAANPPGPQVSCGNIPASTAVTTTAAATTAAATTAAATTAAATTAIVTTTRAVTTTAAATTPAATTAVATTAAVTTTRAVTTTVAATTAAVTTTRAVTTTAAAGTVAPAGSPRPGGQGGAPGAPATGIGGSTQADTNPAWFLLISLLLVASGAGATYAIVRTRK